MSKCALITIPANTKILIKTVIVGLAENMSIIGTIVNTAENERRNAIVAEKTKMIKMPFLCLLSTKI